MEALLKGWYLNWPNKAAIPCGNVHHSWILLLGYGMYHINYQFHEYKCLLLFVAIDSWPGINKRWVKLSYAMFTLYFQFQTLIDLLPHSMYSWSINFKLAWLDEAKKGESNIWILIVNRKLSKGKLKNYFALFAIISYSTDMYD